MYRDEILDLYNNPRNSGKLEDSDIQKEGENPSCGDHLTIYATIEDGEISEIKHESEACAICTAATSILTEEIKGLSKGEIENLDSDWMLEKLGIEVSPMRMKCALLGLKTLQDGVR
ncbi:Fe-S cluster protein [Nanohaloarchaea archaeon H01]|nr:Fe-S cluster protein [Nanohaloarchaea archaeon H01]